MRQGRLFRGGLGTAAAAARTRTRTRTRTRIKGTGQQTKDAAQVPTPRANRIKRFDYELAEKWVIRQERREQILRSGWLHLKFVASLQRLSSWHHSLRLSNKSHASPRHAISTFQRLFQSPGCRRQHFSPSPTTPRNWAQIEQVPSFLSPLLPCHFNLNLCRDCAASAWVDQGADETPPVSLAGHKQGWISGRGSWSSRSLAETLALFLEIRHLGPRSREPEPPEGKISDEDFASRGQQSTSRRSAGSIDNEKRYVR